MADEILLAECESNFFDSIENDRLYDSVSMSKVFSNLIVDGVFKKDTPFQLAAGTFPPDPTAAFNGIYDLKEGTCFFKNFFIKTDEKVFYIYYDIAYLAKRDAIILDIDFDNRKVSIKYIEGQGAMDFIDPVLVDDEHHKQILLFYVDTGVNLQTGRIFFTVTNKVGTVDCPYAKLKAESFIRS